VLAAQVPGGVHAALRAFHYDTALRMHAVGMFGAQALADPARLLLGTDAPLRRSADQLAELASLALPAAVIDGIEGDNARRLFDRYRLPIR